MFGHASGYESTHDGTSAPRLFFLSPIQLWLGPLISKVTKSETLDDDWLPEFAQSATLLRNVFAPLKGEHASFMSFLMQFETGGMLLLGALLELASCAATLGSPLVLHSFLQKPDSALLAATLVAVTLLATVCGRAKDEVCRVHAAWMECMLRSTIFDKSFYLSPAARVEHPPAKIINVSAVDVGFLTTYVLKVHDVWSAPLQIIGIAVLTIGVMGWTSCAGFAIVGVILASQTRLGKRTGKSIRGYISSNDTRISAFRDLLNNIKSVKAGAIEDVFFRKITAARCAQLESLRCFLATSFAVFMAINQTTPYLAACAAFLAYARSGAKLTSDVVFPCLAYFHLLYQPVTLASLAMSRQFTVRPSLARIKELVNAGESSMMAMESDTANSSPAVSFKSASFAWPSKDGIEAVTLHVGELDIPRGKFTAIIGPNGAGKTSLLQAILGQMCFTKGSCHVYGSVAYCAQDPWVMSGTLLENIIFNSPRGYDAQRYGDVIRSCGLDKDFAKLPGGIKAATIGESGSNLSGGQRSRVSLARALYSDADILLLDDPLSALDAHVRSDLFNTLRCLDKSVILVTLHTSFIPQVDHVVVVDDSKIRWAGSQPDLLAQSWVSDYVRHEHSEDAEQEGAVQEAYPRSAVANENSVLSSSGYGDDQDAVDGLWEEEDRARGALQWDVAKFYVRMSGGIAQAGAVIFMVLLLTAAKVISQYWFVWWIGDSIGLSQEQYMGSFLGLTLFQGLVTAGVGLTLVASSLKAARSVHDIILRNLIAAPLWFFQQNPSGRILNRLSRDLEAMDSSITNAVDGLIAASTTMFASVTIVASSGVVVLAAVIPFLVIVGWCLQMFRVTAREVQRLDAILQSPAVSILTESLRDTSSARAYGAVPYLVTRHAQALDRLTAAKITRSSLDTWITFRSELAAAIVLAVLATVTVKDIIPRVSGSLALSTATNLARNVYLLAWAVTDIEIQMNAVERLQHYHDRIPCEDGMPPGEDGGYDDFQGWPESGEVDIDKAYLKYKTRNTAALDNITLHVKKGQKIGVIGRTGSGKSTLVSTIARLVDIQKGTICIGGVNIAEIAPRKLRSAVMTLPQETLIFQGTLRENVDPHGKHTDQHILKALRSCQMSGILERKYGETALDQKFSSDGADLSAGQRQLVCAARVLLEKPAVLLVDEASANVDFDSDDALQRAWQSLPPETTMIAIAHRASSLAWMDRVLVMEDGRIIEDGNPSTLLQENGAGRESYYRTSVAKDGLKAVAKASETAKYWDNINARLKQDVSR